MKQFERALDFIKTHENNAEVLALFLEQLLVEATEEMTQTALDNTEDLQVTIGIEVAYFDFDDVHGNCEFKITNITDESYEVEISNVLATQVIGEVELDYILTDTELDQLKEEIMWCIQDTNLVRDMQEFDNDFDEDEWRYDA